MDLPSKIVAGITLALAILGGIEAVRKWKSSAKWEWDLISVLIFAIGNGVVAALTTVIGIAAARDSAEAHRQIKKANANAAAAVQRAIAAEAAAKPKPFGVRFKATLDGVDPGLYAQFEKGQRVFKLRLKEGDFADLRRLSLEPEGRQLVVFEEGPEGTLVIGNQGGGFEHDVRLTLDPKLLEQDEPSASQPK